MDKNYQTWKEFFNDIQNKEYCISLHKFLDHEYQNYTIFPPRKLLFNAFDLTPLKKVKIVIIGQDPYHEINQAMGLSFSVPKNIKVPPSLINIFKEIKNEYHCEMDFQNGDLTYLAKQGVLLLNSLLSVREHLPLSHNIKEYDLFFKDVLTVLDHQYQPMVFLLWGGPARKYKKYLHNPDHLILECAHPSPLSANRGGWFNNNHFIKANEYLEQKHVSKIEWSNIK
ncbi:MAG: uracil-DNA glycosylase [Bacilli bacterium]|nr:uracil-DNA glycosylase [Bacilli bacterium]